MSRTRYATMGLVALACTVCSHASSVTTSELLTERPSQSLRGQTIDLDDHWNSARLLAHFGESRLAYEVLCERPDSDVIDPQVERFEARLLAELSRPARADSVLALQSYTGGEDVYYRLCLQRARLNIDAGRYDRALGFLSLIDTLRSDLFEPYQDYLSVQALVGLGRAMEAAAVGERRLADGIPVSLSPHFEQQLLDAYLDAEAYDKALSLVRVLKKRPDGSSKLAPLVVREVDILFLSGDSLAAVQAAAGFLADAQMSEYARPLAERLVAATPLSLLPSHGLMNLCSVLLSARRLDGADLAIKELLKRDLGRNDAERLRLHQGDLYYRERRYSKSYETLRDKFSNDSLERNALLIRARIYRKTGQAIRSADTYSEFSRRFPYDAKAAEALVVAADLYLRSADRKRSLETLERVVDTYPSHRYGRVATYRIASYYIERKHFSRAVDILEKALERTGRTSEELMFHLADVYGRMGKPDTKAKLLDELRQRNGMSFYLGTEISTSYRRPILASDGGVALAGEHGLLEFLKSVFDKRETAINGVRAALDPMPEDGGGLEAKSPYLSRGRYFLQMGFHDWAEKELNVLEARQGVAPRIWFELGVLYDDFAMHWRSVRAFQRVYYTFSRDERRSLDGYFRILMYPLPYPASIVENCARYDMAPHLIYAMMREESRFDYNAISRAGAMGLMQLMPATSEQVAGELGFPDGVHEKLFVPEINLTFGIWYASHLLRRADGNAPMMLSAYNAGFGNARRWFRPNLATVDAVENIDYRETRNYVKRIVQSAKIYHMYYFDPEAAGGLP